MKTQVKLPLDSHEIFIHNQYLSILDFVERHKYRNNSCFNVDSQLAMAIDIANIKDDKARELLLKLLEKTQRQTTTIEEMHKEFDTLHNALTKVKEQEDAFLNPPHPK